MNYEHTSVYLNPSVTPTLKAVLQRAQDAAGGMLSIAEFMQIILQTPQHGYYQTVTHIGREGDFVTAPHLSSLFGKIIVGWLVKNWQNSGMPPRFDLVEMGPGQGLLLKDILNYSQFFPDFNRAMRIKCLEKNPFFRDKIQEESKGCSIEFHEDASKLLQENCPAFIVANEFLDALPIHQFSYVKGGWYERKIRIGEKTEFVIDTRAPLNEFLKKNQAADFTSFLKEVPENAIVEISLEASRMVKQLGQHLATAGGAAIMFDYGSLESGQGDTLQAVQHHQKITLESLIHRGGDLSAHVNFDYLKQCLIPWDNLAIRTFTQREFLLEEGIMQLAMEYKPRLDREDLLQMDRALHRLLSPEQMGQLFKVLTIKPAGRFLC